MSSTEGNTVAIGSLERRVTRNDDLIAPIPRVVAKLHEHANVLQSHRLQLDSLLGPHDSLLLQVGELRGATNLLDARLTRIEGAIADMGTDIAKILESHELAKADTAGQWQTRAAIATAVIAALAALAVAAVQAIGH